MFVFRGVFLENWKDTRVVELKKVIGTLLLVGVYQSSNKGLSQLWHMKRGKPIFRKYRVTVFKTYYMSFGLMMRQLNDLAGHQTNFHLLEMYLKFGINLIWMHLFLVRI